RRSILTEQRPASALDAAKSVTCVSGPQMASAFTVLLAIGDALLSPMLHCNNGLARAKPGIGGNEVRQCARNEHLGGRNACRRPGWHRSACVARAAHGGRNRSVED